MKKVTIYTDGACSGNPGPGGWAAVLIYRSIVKEIAGSAAETTNNRMEITAAIEGLKALKEQCTVELYTDSAYLHNAFHEGWIYNWIRNGWKKSDKQPVLNKDLWEELYKLTEVHRVNWNKVKGHADVELNNRCDELARAEIKKMTQTADKEPAEASDPEKILK